MPSSRSPKSGSETGSADRALQRFYFGIGLKGRWGMTTVTGVTGWADTFAVAVAAPENRCNPSQQSTNHRSRQPQVICFQSPRPAATCLYCSRTRAEEAVGRDYRDGCDGLIRYFCGCAVALEIRSNPSHAESGHESPSTG